jgi:hypothetical protein
MPIHWRAGKSPLPADVAARAAITGLACLVVVIQALSAGLRGVWSVLVVAGVAAAAWLIGWLFHRFRPHHNDAGPESEHPVARPSNRAGVIAGLVGLVVVVQALFTGYLGWWSILAVAIATAVAFLNSKNRRLVLLMLLTAAGIAAGVVFLSNMFRGSMEARTLAVAVGAVVVPLFVSDKLFSVFKEPDLKGFHRVALLALTLVFGALGWVQASWLPGVMHGCFTPPTSAGMTVLKMTEDGRCFGLLDTADPGIFARASFGQDPVTIRLENQLLTHNQPLGDRDLTVVWLGALSCDPAPTDPTQCAGGKDYPAERDQLRALNLMQSQLASADHHLHVVIADATQDVAHADDIAQLVIQHRTAFGHRLVVIGGGDSRDQTQHAINRFLDNGIPFIAPNLLADLGSPGKPFVDRSGYLQLAKPNWYYAEDTFSRLSKRYPGGFRLDIYQLPNPADQYTTSLLNDLLAEARGRSGITARHISSLDRLDNSICRSGAAPAGPGPATMLFFADRWTKFMDFMQRVNDVCDDNPPRLVIADGSVSRFMANYQLRETSNVAWRVDYYVGGLGCSDLESKKLESITGQVEKMQDDLHLGQFKCADKAGLRSDDKYCTLDAAAKLVSQPCPPNDLGTFLPPAWDAVRLADQLLPSDPAGVPLVKNSTESKEYLTSLKVDRFETADGSFTTVSGGKLDAASIPIKMWQADPVDDPSKISDVPADEL